ncbi:MAG: lysylphosphatidylglycerol synthase transmembrane domain-containing protein [Candidatus Omnitrophota bacterium]
MEKNGKLNLLKLAITVCLLWAVFARVDISRLKDMLKTVDIVLLAAAFAVLCAGVVLSSFRWKVLLIPQDIRISLGRAVYAYVSGMFFNSFLPTTIGGDVIRARMISPKNYHKGLAATLFERYLGVVALASWALFGALSAYRGGYPAAMIRMAALTSAFILLSFFVLLTLWRREGAGQGKNYKKLPEIIRRFLSSAAVYRNFGSNVAIALLASFMFQFLAIFCVFLITRALRIEVGFDFVIVAATLTALFSSFPVSINGIGLREVSYVFFFSIIGISPTAAVALSFLVFTMHILASAAGGMIFLAGEGRNGIALRGG